MTQKYQVKVSMKQAAIVETGIVLKQGDFGMQIEIEVLDFDATGTTPQIVFRKAMGAVESTTITVSGNKYTYTFKGTELDTPGKCFCDLKLKNSTTQRISTASFMFKVVADTLDGLAEEASSYSDTIAQIVSQIDDEIDAVDEKVDANYEDIHNTLNEYKEVPISDALNHLAVLDGHMYPIFDLELGNFNNNSSEIIYSNHNERVRTKANLLYNLPKGSTIYLTSYTDACFWVAYRNNDTQVWSNSGSWLTSTFTTTLENASYAILIRNLEEKVQDSAYDLGSLLRIDTTGSRIDQIDDAIDQIDDDISQISDTLEDHEAWMTPNKGLRVSKFNVLVPVYLKAGDKVKIATANGNNFTVGRILFHDYNKKSGSGENYVLNGSKSTDEFTIPSGEYYYLSLYNGTEQEILINVLPENTAGQIIGSAQSTLNDRIDNTAFRGYNLENQTYDISAVNKILQGEAAEIFGDHIQGSLAYSGSEVVISYNSHRITTSGYINLEEAETLDISVASGYRIYLFWHNANKEYTVGRGWYEGDFTRPVEGKYLRYIFATAGDSGDISPETFSRSMLSIKCHMKNTRLNEVVDSMATDFVPQYWKTTLASKVAEIQAREALTDAGGDSFVFITDTHWNQNTKKSPALIKNILKNTHINKIIFGGDVLTLHETKAAALEVGRNFFKYFNGTKIYPILGNHDVNNNSPQYGSDSYLSYPEVYSYMYKQIENDVSDLPKYYETNGDVNRNFYYYIDNDLQKIRYIIINNARARIGSVQKSWLQSKISELNQDWTVLVLTHRYWVGTQGGQPVLDGDQGTDIVAAIDEIYDNISAKIAGLIVGHCHYDYSIVTENGYPVIATTTDAYDLSDNVLGPTMEAGTTTEQAFDIYHIDTVSRKIYTTRIGAGSNREFSY